MKKVILLIVWYYTPLCLFSQIIKQYDNNWIFEREVLSFPQNDTLTIEEISDSILLSTSTACISDESGELQFYSNGCVIMNKNYSLMDGGGNINYPGIGFDFLCLHTNPIDYGVFNGLYILPIPESQTKYAMLHMRRDEEDIMLPTSILYTEVDMSYNGGLGKVIKKNELIYQDTFLELFSAVQHGNGRDWWLTTPLLHTDSILQLLITPNGVDVNGTKKIGLTPFLKNDYRIGQTVYSHDGRYYAQFSNTHTNANNSALQVTRFDRCTGEYSCAFELNYKVDPAYLPLQGVSFSPNSRFLYFTLPDKLYQMDLASEKPWENIELIAEHENVFNILLPIYFHQMQLAPNGVIYMSGINGNKYIHCIKNPNEKGKSCNFEQYGVELLFGAGFNLPKFPNYNLFDWPNSPCDTLGINGLQAAAPTGDHGMSIAPNPTQNQLNIYLPHCEWELHGAGTERKLRIFNMAGQMLYERQLPATESHHQVDVSFWASGVYVAEYLDSGQREVLRFQVLH